MSSEPKFLTPEEAGQLIGYSHWTVRRWLRKGLLVRYKVGVRTLVSRLELLSLIEQQKGSNQ